MQKTQLFLAFLFTLAGPGLASEHLVNGDFEQPLDVGWVDTANVEAGTYLFERSDTFAQPTPGFAAKVHKELARYASLYQTVDVPGVDLTLSCDARLKIGGGSSTCWPVASIWVRYADSAGLELGNTRICRSSVYSTWTKSDTVSIIEIDDTTGAWGKYSLDLRQEITNNLPGINPDNVKKITIDLFAYDNGTWSGGWAEVSADNVSLATTGIEESHLPVPVPVTVTASPNPFTASTTIQSTLPAATGSSLRLYDAAGNLVRSLSAQGPHVLSGSGLKPGVYVLRAGDQSTRLVKAAN